MAWGEKGERMLEVGDSSEGEDRREGGRYWCLTCHCRSERNEGIR